MDHIDEAAVQQAMMEMNNQDYREMGLCIVN